MIYSGLKYNIEHPGYEPTFVAPAWASQLTWEHQQILPSPYQEITHDEWFLLGQLSDEAENESFYDCMNIPGEKEWFGGWSCYIRFYYTYALVSAHRYVGSGHLNEAEIEKGIIIRRDQYGSYIVRFFKLGCEHIWLGLPSESYMCYHARVCTKCGMRNDIDSSG